MLKRFFSFGKISPKQIAKVALYTIILAVIIKYSTVFFPQIYNPFNISGNVILKIKQIVEFLIQIIYVRISCELLYYIFSALNKYIR